ncbi:hypothetical protein FRB99_007724 [Tulasnella sp. 403]|nr:hypothetical protein FRB99_007724 [Tulasnella sp. 403]
MATFNAPKSVEDLESLLRDANKVKVAGIDIDGVFRGKYMSKSKFMSAAKNGFGFCSVIFGWDINDTVYSRELLISNRANGYRDLLASIDLATYRRIPWENDVPLFLVTFLDPDTKEPICACPRGTLSKAVGKLAEHGWEAMAGIEYEYFQFNETAHSAAEKNFNGLTPLTPGMHGYSLLRTTLNSDYFNALFDLNLKFGVEIEGHHTETGPGVFETALAYTSALRMADNASLFKLGAKSIGMKYGMRVPGADVQPHLALSAIFLTGLRGIEKKLSLPLPPISELKTAEDRKVIRKLSTSLEAAAARMMRDGSVAREVFGDEFVDHFGGTREHEVAQWNAAVTNWESKPLHLSYVDTTLSSNLIPVERYLELV